MKTSLVLTNCEGSPDFSVHPSFWQLASSESFPLGSESWEGFQALRRLAGAGWLLAPCSPGSQPARPAAGRLHPAHAGGDVHQACDALVL